MPAVKRFATAGIPVAIIVAAWIIAWYPRDAVYGVDAAATRSAVLKIIPIGSRIDFAKATLEAKGFTCALAHIEPFVGDDPSNSGRSIAHSPSDFLWCDSVGWGGFLIDKRWQIILVMKDDAVASVEARVSLTGL